MKKILILIAFMFSLFSFSVNATERLKSVEYDAIVNDPNGIDVIGKYKDENEVQREMSTNIKYNTRVKVLYEYMKNNNLYGHINYTTTIVVKNEDEIKNITNVKPDSHDDQVSNNNSNKQENITNKKQEEEKSIKPEVTKTIEIEADIDLSKCRVDDEFSLSNAVNLNEKRKIMIISQNGLETYKGPAFGYEKLGYVIPTNTELEYNIGVVNQSYNNDDVAWVYIETENVKGWLYKGLLDSGVAEYKEGRILSFVNTTIRELPNEDSKKIKTLPKKMRKSFTYEYGIEDTDGDKWYYINYEGKKGWVKNVAFGVNAEINILKNTKLYQNPNLEIAIEDKLISKGTKLQSIYMYTEDNKDYFYIKYKSNEGWIILDKNDPTFEVKYKDDLVNDKLLDKKPIKKETKKSEKNILKYVIVSAIIILIIIILLIMIIKKRRKQSNDFTVKNGDISNNNEKPKVILINRSRMGR